MSAAHRPGRRSYGTPWRSGCLALVCGLRRGELAGLRWSDVDLRHATLSVVEQRTTDADWQIVTKERKGTSRRTIDLGPVAVAALREHRTRVLGERSTGEAWTDSGLVFARVTPADAPPRERLRTEMFGYARSKNAIVRGSRNVSRNSTECSADRPPVFTSLRLSGGILRGR